MLSCFAKWSSSTDKWEFLQRLPTDIHNLFIQNRCTTAEARLAATREQSESAKEEATEWRCKYEAAAADTKAAIERATAQKDRAISQAQLREDSLRAEFATTVSQKVIFFFIL